MFQHLSFSWCTLCQWHFWWIRFLWVAFQPLIWKDVQRSYQLEELPDLNIYVWQPRRSCASLFFRSVLFQVIMSVVIMSGPKLSVAVVFWMKVCDKESNALMKSIRTMSAIFFLFMVCLIELMRFMMQLPILVCFMNAFCWHPMVDSTAGWIHWVIAQEGCL